MPAAEVGETPNTSQFTPNNAESVINGPGLFRSLQKPVPTSRLIDTLEDAWRSHMLDSAKRAG